MKSALLPLAFVTTTTLVACSFEMHAGTKPQTPANAGTATTATNTTAAPRTTLPTAGGPRTIGKRTGGATGPTPAPSTTTTVPTTPTAVPTSGSVVAGSTIFGNGTVDAAGFKGTLYWIPAGTTTMPNLASLTPSGFLFTRELNVASQAFSGGFPGIDATKTSNFAIRYEAPLVVTTEADYDFRLVSDDGAVLKIDNTSIVDNDGVKTAAASKEGPVHLVTGTHVLTVDYFQTSGPVALQVFCKKVGDTEKVCPTSL